MKLVDMQGLKPCPLRVLVQVQAQVYFFLYNNTLLRVYQSTLYQCWALIPTSILYTCVKYFRYMKLLGLTYIIYISNYFHFTTKYLQIHLLVLIIYDFSNFLKYMKLFFLLFNQLYFINYFTNHLFITYFSFIYKVYSQ